MPLKLIVTVLALAATFPTGLWAGIIQGAVTERSTGRPLARTIVELRPVPTPLDPNPAPIQLRTNRSGGFTFISLPPGRYTLAARREGFLPAEFGQRRPSGYGLPIIVTEDSNTFAELAMGRVGSITGTVLDQNGVGIPHVPVLAYPAELPLRAIAEATTDDRGIYRIAGLLSGQYWVRSSSHQLEDGTGLLPTFARETLELRDTRVQTVLFDKETSFADIIPVEGRLYSLSGLIHCEAGASFDLSVASESTTKHVSMTCPVNGEPTGYSFSGLAPGHYEAVAEYTQGSGGGFLELDLSDNTKADLQLIRLDPRRVRLSVQGLPAGADWMKLIGRRDDLGGVAPVTEVTLPLSPGYWQLHAGLPPGFYVTRIEGDRTGRGPRWTGRGDLVQTADWFTVFASTNGFSSLNVTVSSQVGSLEGTVMNGASAVAGAPVTLVAAEELVNRQAGGRRQVFADTDGRFSFKDLPPGDYRVLATFDERDPKLDTFEEARARVVRVDAGEGEPLTLSLWQSP